MGTLFACQVAYGYLSLPFFLFTIPYLQVVLTHAVPTAYDRQGRVQKYTRPSKPPSTEPKQSMVDRLTSRAELGDVVDNMKNISQGLASSMLTQMTEQASAAKGQLAKPFDPTPIVLGTGTQA